MIKLVLVRHGESTWNKENKFTGWTDVELSPQGIQEAKTAGEKLQSEGYSFDLAYTSTLKRASETLKIILETMGLTIETKVSWRLNEKHYGALQGLSKSDTAKTYGEEQVYQWRREYDCRPPPLSETDERHPANDEKYQSIEAEPLPATESLKDVVARVTPYWKETIAPNLLAGRKTIVVAHGNSLRALIKYLDNIPDEAIAGMNIPTGIPLVYELDEELKPINNYYLASPETIAEQTRKVANQGLAR